MPFVNRKSTQWKEWRRKVYRRDSYTCQMCNRKGGDDLKMAPHHIIPKAWKPKYMFEVWNGITLCWDCHENVTGEEKRWIEFFFQKLKIKGERYGLRNGRNEGRVWSRRARRNRPLYGAHR